MKIFVDTFRSVRSLPRDARFVMAAAGVNQLGSVLEGFLIVYLVHAGFTAGEAALAVGAFAVGTLLGAPVGAAATSRFGPRAAMAGALGLTGVVVALIPATASGPLALVVAHALTVGVTTQAFRPPSSEALSLAVPAEDTVVAFSAFRVTMNAGALVAPLVAAAAIAWDQWTLLFLLDGATSLAAAGLVTRIGRRRAGAPGDHAHQEQAGAIWAALLTPRRLLYVGAMLTSGVVYAQTFSVVPVHLGAAGHDPSLYAAILSLGAITLVLLELPVTTATKSWPVPLAVLVGTAVFGLSFALYGLAPAAAAVAVLASVLCIAGTTVSAPRLWSFPAGSPAAVRPAMFAASQAAFGLGMALGPVVGVAAWESMGQWWWGAVAGIGILSALAGAYGTRPEAVGSAA